MADQVAGSLGRVFMWKTPLMELSYFWGCVYEETESYSWTRFLARLPNSTECTVVANGVSAWIYMMANLLMR